MFKPGVYTASCPECKIPILMHLAKDGSINPHHCSVCEIEFEGIEDGEVRNSYVGIVKGDKKKREKEKKAEEKLEKAEEKEKEEDIKTNFGFSKKDDSDKKTETKSSGFKKVENKKKW